MIITQRLKWIAWIGILCCAGDASATTVVTLVSAHGIVVCADGKSTGVENSGDPGRPSKTTKVFVIRDRFAVSHEGFRTLDFWHSTNGQRALKSFPYSLNRMLADIRREASLTMTLARVADLIRANLISQFSGFDDLPKSGDIRRVDIPPPRETITAFTVSGFEAGVAHVYEVAVNMDWPTLSHKVPPVRDLMHEQGRKNLGVFIAGHSEASLDLHDYPDAPATREFIRQYPREAEALLLDKDLDVEHMVRLSRALLALEISRNPDDVGYPLTIVTMLRNGKITTQSFSDR